MGLINTYFLIVAIEKEFDIELNTAEVAKLSNVGEMIQLIEKEYHNINFIINS